MCSDIETKSKEFERRKSQAEVKSFRAVIVTARKGGTILVTKAVIVEGSRNALLSNSGGINHERCGGITLFRKSARIVKSEETKSKEFERKCCCYPLLRARLSKRAASSTL